MIPTTSKDKYLNGTPPKYNSIRLAANIIAAVEKLAGKMMAHTKRSGANNFHTTLLKSVMLS